MINPHTAWAGFARRPFGAAFSKRRISIPNGVTNIGAYAFAGCSGLTNGIIGNRVTNIMEWAFAYCSGLATGFFEGNVPDLFPAVFYDASQASLYYLPGTSGWGATLGGRPTALWQPQVQTRDPGFGVRTNQFGFRIAWASGWIVREEACTDPVNGTWSSVATNTLADGSAFFVDPEWMNYPVRFYRLAWP